MKTFVKTIEIAAPTARVWQVMLDVDRWSEWTPTVRRSTRLEGAPFELGTRVRILQPRLPPAIWTVTRIESGAGFGWTTRGPGFTVLGDHDVRAQPGGSLAILSLTYSGPVGHVLAWCTRGIIERYLALEAASLKARCEDVVVTTD
jgi:Polyketide cyclase / dehydrase and lipid transport